MIPGLVRRLARFFGLLVVSWVAMTTTHEVGHLLGGWIGGATLKDFDLMPWRLPHSLHQPDPHPLLTLWAGPIFGIAAPIAIAFVCRWQPATFVADFCLLANGLYLALAWMTGDRFLDTARLLDAGTPPWLLATFCGVTICAGYIRFRTNCTTVLSKRDAVRASR
ncbi:MAG: hypothetical protein AAFU85_17385 [Planctomycetota bacterium]